MEYDKNFLDWVTAHAGDDPNALRLKFHSRSDMDYGFAITQTECRRRFGTKLPATLEHIPRFIFPSVLAGEQATADIMAEYHSGLIIGDLPVADLTAGLGIDVLHMASRTSANVTAIEMDNERAEALRYNVSQAGIDNITVVGADCRTFVSDSVAQGRQYGTIFIDPARRDSDGARVYALGDCRPDVTALMPMLRLICRRLIIKASPMLDITHTVEALQYRPTSISAVGVPTECRELLAVIDFDNIPDDTIEQAVTLSASTADIFAFTRREEEQSPEPTAGEPKPGQYIYEPWPTVMKTGAYKTLAASYCLNTFGHNTRLFHSPRKSPDFPGNSYCIIEVLPYASKVIKRFRSRYPRANVATRNFGMSTDALRTKLGIADGGDIRVYGITDARNERRLIVCRAG